MARMNLRWALRGAAPALLAGLFGVYLLTMSGHTYSPDEETMLATAEAVALHGTFAIPASRALVEVPGLHGQIYSQYGPGQPVAAVPWIWVGHLLGALLGGTDAQQGFVVRLVLGSFNLLVAAALAAVLFALARALGAGRRGALVPALLLAGATFLWPMSRTFFAEPLTALLVFGAFAALAAPPRRPGLAGLLAALVLAVKIQYVVALPALGALALWQAWTAWRRGDRAAAGRGLGAFALGGIVGLAPLLLYDTLAFGSPFTSGYHQSFAETFTTPLGEGLAGLLLSPGKGLWLYAPPLFLGLAGFVPFARRRPALAATIAGVVLPVLVLFSLYRFWPGDGAWGPRYLLPIVPFLLLPIVALLPAADAPRLRFAAWPAGRRLLAAAVVAAGLAGLAVQGVGLLVNFDTYINLVNDDATRYWNSTYSPVRGQWTVLQQRVGLWADRLLRPGDTALLTSGFSYSEGDKYAGDLFPRWTTGAARLDLPAAALPLTLTLRLADHRPPPLPRAPITVTLAGAPVPAARAPVSGSPVESVLTATLPAAPGASGRVTLGLDTPTWNPKTVGSGARNEDLGLMVEALALTRADGAPLRLADGLPVQPYYAAPRWYYDTQSAHLADLWAWYLVAADLPRRVAWPLAAGVLVGGIGALVWGIRRGGGRRPQRPRHSRRRSTSASRPAVSAASTARSSARGRRSGRAKTVWRSAEAA